MWTKKYSLATLLRCDILNKTNIPSCRVCKIYLDKNNTYASMLKRHNHICKECHKSQVEKRNNILHKNLASNSKKNSIELGVKIKDRAIRMMREGKGLPEVSRILGVHENTVRSWKKREIEDWATSEFSKNTESKGASLDDIIGTWGVNKTSIEFEISKNNQNAVTITAWSKKTKEKYQVSEIICNENKNGVLLVIQFQSLWVPRKWKTTWTLYPQRLDGRVDVMRCEYLTQSGHEGESNARRLGIQVHQYKCSKCGFLTTSPGALGSHQNSCTAGQRGPAAEEKKLKALAVKRLTRRKREEALQMVRDGVPIRDVGDITGIPYATIYGWAKKSNLPTTAGQKAAGLRRRGKPAHNARSAESKEEALQMVREGISLRDIEKRTGIPYATIYGWVKRGNMRTKKKRKARTKKKPTALKQEALMMIREGATGVAVAKRLGVHKDTVRKWRKAAGLSGKSGWPSGSPLKEEGLIMIKEGITGGEVARRLGVSPGTVTRWRRDAGLSGKDGKKFHEVDKENDVIDLLREGRSMHHINKSTGVGKKSILRIKADAEREGFL